ncbi:MAG: hypothetical protein ACC628_15455 [Pirellulaceae bacterium]
MQSTFLRRHLVLLTYLVMLGLPPSLAGCAWMESFRGEGFRELEPDWSEGFRPLSQPGKARGTSTKARQVERNLGVQ